MEKNYLDLTLSQRFTWVISDQKKKKKNLLFLVLKAFSNGDSIDFLKNQFQNFTVSWCQTPRYSLYPFYLARHSHRERWLPFLFARVVYILKGLLLHLFSGSLIILCCSPLFVWRMFIVYLSEIQDFWSQSYLK